MMPSGLLLSDFRERQFRELLDLLNQLEAKKMSNFELATGLELGNNQLVASSKSIYEVTVPKLLVACRE